ncbi:hypothetical protein ABQF34_08600 [Mycolicibacterium boenickei]
MASISPQIGRADGTIRQQSCGRPGRILKNRRAVKIAWGSETSPARESTAKIIGIARDAGRLGGLDATACARTEGRVIAFVASREHKITRIGSTSTVFALDRPAPGGSIRFRIRPATD